MSRPHGTGYVPPEFEHRGTYREFSAAEGRMLAGAEVNLVHLCGGVRDQGPVGSCLPHAIVSAEELWARRCGLAPEPLSALALYAAARRDAGRDGDTGLTTAQAFAAAASGGLVPEHSWSDDPERWREVPPADVRAESSARRRLLHTMPLPHSAPDVAWALISGQGVVAGLRLYDSSVASVERGGPLALPAQGEEPYAGHGVLVIGYSASRKTFLSQWAWGTAFGDAGFVEIPDAFLLDPYLCPELHAILSFRRLPAA